MQRLRTKKSLGSKIGRAICRFRARLRSRHQFHLGCSSNRSHKVEEAKAPQPCQIAALASRTPSPRPYKHNAEIVGKIPLDGIDLLPRLLSSEYQQCSWNQEQAKSKQNQRSDASSDVSTLYPLCPKLNDADSWLYLLQSRLWIIGACTSFGQ
ncbi:hypothetical protein AKJ16_DCAP02760 [Drosera capensis]